MTARSAALTSQLAVPPRLEVTACFAVALEAAAAKAGSAAVGLAAAFAVGKRVAALKSLTVESAAPPSRL